MVPVRSQPPRRRDRPLTDGLPPSDAAVGRQAPGFTLRSAPDQSLSLAELRGNPVVLVFYPADFSPVCGDQLGLYNELLSEFHSYDARFVGISVDGVWSHAAFARARHLHFPLLADFEPKGDVARRYGVYDGRTGMCRRALFVLDTRGIVRWRHVSPPGINPGADGVLEALDRLGRQEGERA